MRAKFLAIFAFLAAHSAPLLASKPPMYQDVIHDQPEISATTVAYLGDRMIWQSTGQWKDCITPKFSSDSKKFLAKLQLKIRANQQICKKYANDKGYRIANYNFIESNSLVKPDFEIKKISDERRKIQIVCEAYVYFGFY